MRHRDAGYRYAVEGERTVLRAEFTPTTPFGPQSDTLTKGSFRAWNALADRHEYALVRVRVDEMHHRADEINETLTEMEETYRETGRFDGDPETDDEQRQRGGPGCSEGTGGTTRGYSADAPF